MCPRPTPRPMARPPRASGRAARTARPRPGIVVKSIGDELGISLEPELHGDATAAQQNARKVGPGKMRHVEASQFFIKEAVRRRLVKLVKCDGKDNNVMRLGNEKKKCAKDLGTQKKEVNKYTCLYNHYKVVNNSVHYFYTVIGQ